MNNSRRQFLAVSGAVIGLPFLPSLARAERDARKPAKNLVIMYIPNGIVRRCFFPGEEVAEIPGFVGGFDADKTKKDKRIENKPGTYPPSCRYLSRARAPSESSSMSSTRRRRPGYRGRVSRARDLRRWAVDIVST